jgi:hypothetical protein
MPSCAYGAPVVGLASGTAVSDGINVYCGVAAVPVAPEIEVAVMTLVTVAIVGVETVGTFATAAVSDASSRFSLS